MSDFTTLVVNYNTGTDLSPIWTGTALAFGGSSGANELRWSSSANGTTGSAAWPANTRPTSGTAAVTQLWAYPTDTAGNQVNYNGTNSVGLVLRFNWDALGTFASPPQFSCFSDSTMATPVPGTQPGAQSGSPIINGSSADTGSTAYVKINGFGYGVDASGNQQTPSAGAAGTTLAVTSGTAGSVSPATGAWLATWQSAQGWVQYITNGVTPKATTAGFWYFSMVLYTGVNMSTGILLPVLVFQYLFM